MMTLEVGLDKRILHKSVLPICRTRRCAEPRAELKDRTLVHGGACHPPNDERRFQRRFSHMNSGPRRMLRIARSALALVLALTMAPGVFCEQPVSTIPGEAIYPRPSQEVWGHVTALLREWKFSVQKEDKKNQVIVTQWRDYDETVMLTSAELGLRPDDRVKKIQLHIMVAADHEPARVIVGSIVELDRREGNRTTSVMGYRVLDIEDWFLARLDERVGAKHELLGSTFSARVEQAKRLGIGAPSCSPKGDPKGKPSPPVKLSDVRPIFPAQGFSSGPRTVEVRGVLTEHGTLTDLVIVDPAPQFAHFQSSARAAAGLWRFRPTIHDGCPVPVTFTVTVNYRIQ
jgi:hypothetical protein